MGVMSVFVWSMSLVSQASPPAPQAPPPPVFEGSAEFSYVGTSGNSDTQSLGAGATVTFRPAHWEIASTAALIRSKDAGVTKAQSSVLSTQAERSLTGTLSLFGGHEYLRNRFAGVNHRHTLEAGVWIGAITNARQELEFEIGIGYAHEQRLAGPNRSSAISTASASYTLTLSDTATFENEIQTVAALDKGRDQRVTNVAALSAKLNTLFSLKVRHTTRWVRSPVPGFRKTDTTMAVALVAKF
jgi:putative salt-induced outer membrane protein